ncbi:tyrosyl-tRNA synthetase [Williamsoniiplasma somnilux]|uniref:Tyrosine--tRNA ligase n=1 Tax=Williamsoniiplasma somnilux TaxID=215578 RepID=A0A2K8P0Z8_9MOLU|nr:tyrosine--tRNA ligase [Williamsoniiplasma somnilux]ATZ18573.1 tyrosyl-tRNA synthetase [Williamsoniiplasma somnilux]
MNIIEELNWRGLVKQITNEEKLLNAQNENRGVYCGFDPTADSLHVGHLIPIILLERFRRVGFQPIALLGGGTGMIGDPSFKSAERVLQTNEQVDKNVLGIETQLRRLIPNVDFQNNAKWLRKLSLIDFLRDVGKNFTLGYLLAKESIATRIETGLSVTEFAYTMLQGYDFYQLYTTSNCFVQIGGSDQWGNITSGIDYIGTQIGRENSGACGLTIKLLAKKDGKKFGKSESGAVWLDSQKTSEYDFYQFWLNQDDEDCEQMLKFITFLNESEINEVIHQHNQNPSARILQKKLAEEVTKFVHGEEGYIKALKLTEAFFNGELINLNKELFEIALTSIPSLELIGQTTAIDAIVAVGAATSKREAREFINANAISFNNSIISDENELIEKTSPINKKYIVVRRGKKKYYVIKLK